MEQNSSVKDNFTDNIEEEEGETVCYCFDVTDTVIKKVIREHKCEEVDQVTDICNAGGGCTSCHPDIEELIEEIMEEMED